MEYQTLIDDFARRTRENLKQLRALQVSGVQFYEFTALVNSMLGLLVFPQGWPIPKVVGDFPQVPNLRQLLRYLRNAISHFNIEFLADGAGRLSGLRVWNVDQKGRTTWKAELSESDLDEIAHRFISLILREQQTGEGAV